MQTDPNWLQTRRRQEEGKKRIRAGWSVSTLGKHSAGRLSMFFLVFNHRSVWRGCCDLDNNFLQHIYIPNFFLSWVNQHAICNAPGGNLWKVAFFPSFTFFAESKNHSTSIFTWTACKYLPKSPSSTEEEQREKAVFFQPVLWVRCILQAGEQSGGAFSSRGLSGRREEIVYTCAAARSPSSHASVTRPTRCPPVIRSWGDW